METRIVGPATTAKDYLQPLRKTLKSRENKKLDFERYQDRVLAAHKKMKKTEKENASLARYEQDLAKAAEVGIRRALITGMLTLKYRTLNMQICVCERVSPL